MFLAEPVCWNWQTRRTQNPLLETACGFDPRHRHHEGAHSEKSEWAPFLLSGPLRATRGSVIMIPFRYYGSRGTFRYSVIVGQVARGGSARKTRNSGRQAEKKSR